MIGYCVNCVENSYAVVDTMADSPRRPNSRPIPNTHLSNITSRLKNTMAHIGVNLNAIKKKVYMPISNIVRSFGNPDEMNRLFRDAVTRGDVDAVE